MPPTLNIAFVHPGKAFLPELEAYKRFFGGLGIQCQVLHPSALAKQHIDIEWHIMGTHFKRVHPEAILIHEYASLSTPPFASAKDLVKKWLNCRPDFRLFLNEEVSSVMDFNDGIPFGFRDMFVSSAPAAPGPLPPKYDFIYIGSVSRERKAQKLLDVFGSGAMRNNSILILSQNFSDLQQLYREFPNISFSGPVEPAAVGQFIQQARYAINYQPPYRPFNLQTSSKFLEYAAQRKPIITSDNTWTRNFQRKYGGRFFYLKDDLSNFTPGAIQAFEFSQPELTGWTFLDQVIRSGVLDYLRKKTGLDIFDIRNQVVQ
ncbi:hypothetical protein KJS94_07685 [Flavihumibacter rivuli]|uniref:hypothetical protein n=1 Tax=Flavihumibacter rivuli TaxID=2838156 RepID=UPI001BDE0E21|nr:hypothetical protein [Flavihumibacter rivuli]ULQ58082.1 hypothetical protein KJS94_07685 [Flavihumibacter rivuli]